ncbi:DNA-binding LacI/PurR family transcriptional regulator [Clostridium moniliforme]|uniref:DNA-binding LacI/PurR family transcriptional regulator n=1 Tax=Clostridium moniliforme TaxID=39489 RepID=A0ABS4F074_9CLOT|nr:LacI family DNA-binding transcriptional regulator [Clostridium moniliforme]MBP1889642.1 DNA-binding LacI/PurR family transcriptional regulator [Clostridium moniliforme]
MKKVTIKDIADMAGTSKTTVSFYLNGKFEKMSAETKYKIEEVIKKTNYSPSIVARSLTSKKMNLIGVVVADICNPFSSTIVKGIDKVARKEDYQIIVGSSNFDFKYEEEYINRMLDMGADGFIVQATAKFSRLIDKIKARGKKLVLLDSVDEEFKGNFVKTNNYNITSEAVKKLVQKGYNNFTLITEDPNLLMARLERKNGFIDTLEKLNINYSVEVIDNNIESNDIEKAVNNNLDLSKKNLIFAINGKVLQRTYDYIKTQEFDIPNDVGLIGFDDWEWTRYATPTISTISQPTYEEGKYAARILIDMIEECKEDSKSLIFPCNINWNESTNLTK